MNKMKRIAVVIPSRDMVHTDFALSLANLMTRLSQAGVAAYMVNPRHSTIDKGRNTGVMQALDRAPPDALLFLDSDQLFPFDIVDRLSAHDELICGASSVTRQEPVHFTATDTRDGKYIDFRRYRNEPEPVEVKTVGFGCMLIRREVFEEIPFPWFETMYRGEGEHYMSEDEFFCLRARAHGFRIMIDGPVSCALKHVGSHRFSVDDMETLEKQEA